MGTTGEGSREHDQSHTETSLFDDGRGLRSVRKLEPHSRDEIEPWRKTEVAREMVMLLDLAISRCRASKFADGQTRELIRGALEAAKQEITHLEDRIGQTDTTGNTRSRTKVRSVPANGGKPTRAGRENQPTEGLNGD